MKPMLLILPFSKQRMPRNFYLQKKISLLPICICRHTMPAIHLFQDGIPEDRIQLSYPISIHNKAATTGAPQNFTNGKHSTEKNQPASCTNPKILTRGKSIRCSSTF